MLEPSEAQNAVKHGAAEREAPPKSEDTGAANEDNSVPSVSILEGDNDDDSRMSGSKKGEEEEEEEQSYESDYEYHDEEDEEDTSTNRGATAAASSLKRKDLPSIDSEDDNLEDELRRSFPRRGNLKSTGLEEEDYASSSIVNSIIRTTPTAVTFTSEACGICHHPEVHAPVLDCSMISAWQDLTRNKASGVLPVDPTAITACMHRRIRECQEWLQRMWEQGLMQDHPEFYEALNSPDLVAVDLRRHRWNEEAWKRGYVNYYRLTMELQTTTHERTRQRLHQEMDRIGIRQGMHEETVAEAPVEDPEPAHEYQRYAAAVQLEHDAFLNSTTENTTAATNTIDDESVREQQPADNSTDAIVGKTVVVAAAAAAATPVDADDSEEGSRGATDTTSPRRANATSRMASSVRGVVTRMMSAGRTAPVPATPIEATGGANTETTTDEKAIASSETVAEEGTNATEGGNWICEICTDDEVEEEDRLSMECGHTYCRDCWIQFIAAMLEDVQAAGGLLHMTVVCPHQRCRRKVTRRHVEYMVTPPAQVAAAAAAPIPPLLQLYDELALNSFVQGHANTLRWCPGPNCEQVMVVSRRGLFLYHRDSRDVTNFAKCTTCQFRYCLQCGENHNHDQPCHLIVPIERPAEDGAAGPAAAAGGVQEAPPLGGQNQAQDDEKKTDKKIRLCPMCKVPIEKNGGCNHMSVRFVFLPHSRLLPAFVLSLTFFSHKHAS